MIRQSRLDRSRQADARVVLTSRTRVPSFALQSGEIQLEAESPWLPRLNPWVAKSEAVLLMMTPNDARKRITWSPEVVTAAAENGLAMDANGYVALKKFTDRSQR